MKSEWTKVTLLSVCSRLSSGKSISSKLLKEKGVVPVYGGNGVRGYIEEGENFNGECAIIGRQGAYCGNVRFFSGKAYMTEHAIVVQANACADTRFLAYKLSLMQLGRLSGQSAQPGLSVKVLGEQVIDIPPLPIQRKIASILSALDDKIETNNAICRNLKEQAQALYKSWFVDFNPIKENGFIESEMGLIPEQWKIAKLSELADVMSGKRPKKKTNTPNEKSNVPILGASGIMGYTDDGLYMSKILVIGRVGTHGVVQRCNEKCWPSDNTLVVKTHYYEYVNQILERIDYAALNRGSTQPLITQSDINNTNVLLPPVPVLEHYEEKVGEWMRLRDSLKKENNLLEKMKENLLPKLMNGELDVDSIKV